MHVYNGSHKNYMRFHSVNSSFFFLSVEPPKITQHPVSRPVATGQPAVFTVEATGDHLQFQWQKDDKDIDRNMPWIQVSQTDKSSSLHIQCVKKSDRGYYKCLVRNQVAESGRPSHLAELTVSEYSFYHGVQ